MIVQEQQLFTEIFPVDVDNLAPLSAYQVGVSRGDIDALGAALAGRLEMEFGGHWVWVRARLLTDNPPNPARLLMAVDALTGQEPRLFPRSTTVEQDYSWQPSAQDVADFVIAGPLADLDPLFRDALAKTTYRLRNARVERDYRVYAWAVDGYPSVSFSIDSRLIYDPDLATYAAAVKDLDAVIGLRVSDKLSTLQGEVIAVVGTLAEQRQRLTAITHHPEMRELLAAAPDADPVVRVQAGRYEYDYPATALNVVISMDDARRFDVTSQDAAKALGVKPALRAQLVKVIADIAKAERLVTSAYSTPLAPEAFDFAPADFKIALGAGPTRYYEPSALPAEALSDGLYWLRDKFAQGKEPLRLGVINASSGPAEDFLVAMGRAMQRSFGIAVEVVRERKVRVVNPTNLESAVRLLQKVPFDVIVAFVDTPSDEPDGSDHFVRMQTIGRGLSCLIIDESVLNDPDSMPAVMLGLLARAGSAPFLFDLPLPYTDYVVGLDLIPISRRGGDSVTGIARVYRNDGGLLWYMVASAPVEDGHGIPPTLLAQLFPADYFAGRRILIHSNGRLTDAARQSLDQWSAQLDAIFCPVELSREGTPRLYALANGRIACPLRGSLFRLGPNEAFLVSREHEDFQPLYVRSDTLPLDQAVQSVMQFAALSYSPVPAAMPATLLNADLVGISLIRGVMPDNVSGDVPFWL